MPLLRNKRFETSTRRLRIFWGSSASLSRAGPNPKSLQILKSLSHHPCALSKSLQIFKSLNLWQSEKVVKSKMEINHMIFILLLLTEMDDGIKSRSQYLSRRINRPLQQLPNQTKVNTLNYP